MIKIVHVIIGLNVGGAELMLKRLIESHLTTSSIQHTVISLTSLGVLGPELQKQGVNVYSLNMSTMLKGPLVLFKLRALLKKLQPDVVHSWMYHADLLAGIAAFSLGIKNIVWGIRSTDITKGGSKVTLIIRKICAYLSYRIPKKVLCAANTSKNVHIKVGYDASNMQVIPNGFEINNFIDKEATGWQLRKVLKIPDNALAFISVGRFSPVKDHKTFILAACELLKKDRNAHFILVGRELTKENIELTNHISAHGLESNFHLLGQRSDVPICLASADVFCLHSVTEGFPNVLGEAMLSGLPCITTDVGDARFLLGADEMTVKPSDSKLLAQKMETLSGLSEVERKEIGLSNRKRIIDKFSLSTVSNQYMKLYLELAIL